MGPKPSPKWTLDRIDTRRREYGPGLCRWADAKTQSENRINTRWVELNGERITAAELARRAGRPASTVYAALDAGKSPREIMVGPTDTEFRPLGLTDEHAIQEWRHNYREWLRKAVHPAKHRLAPPALFDLLMVSFAAAKAEEALEQQGFLELTPDEDDRAAELLASEAGQMRWRIAPERAQHALSSLRASHPKLVANLTNPNGGYHLLTYHRWGQFLRTPP